MKDRLYQLSELLEQRLDEIFILSDIDQNYG